MQLNIEIEVQGCDQADINVTNQCETITLEIFEAPTGGGVSIDDAAGLGDTDVTWSADKSSRELADMEQSNEAAVQEATRQAGLAEDSAVIATEQAGIAASRAGESAQSAQAAGQYASTATEQAGLAADSEEAAEQAATIATTKADEASQSAQAADQSAAQAEEALGDKADKFHTHVISDVTGLSDRLDSIDALIGDVESVLIIINGEP